MPRNHFSAAVAGCALALASFVASPASSATSFPHVGGTCPRAVNVGLSGVSNALMRGDEHVVLSEALRAERTARACGDLQDSISFELIAADAYGDVNAAHSQCAALRDAARRMAAFSDQVSVARARSIRRAADSCRA